MGLEYYAFALFVAGLICAIAIICKMLFANVKRQQKLLDERESQILQLYTSVETLMEEFGDQVKATTDELKEYEYRATSHITAFDLPAELEKKEQVLEKLPRTLPLDANRRRAAGEVLERAERIIKNDTPAYAPVYVPAPITTQTPEKEHTGAVFQRFFDESAESPPPTQNSPEAPSTLSRSETIMAMAREGKSDVEIASQLGITRNEVQLVVGLTR
jgi:hypothetical protein